MDEDTLVVESSEDTQIESTKTPEATAKSGKDWEAAYKGFQKTYDKLKTKMETLEAKYDALSEESEALKQTNKELESQRVSLTKQLEDAGVKVKEFETQVQSHAVSQERVKLIMSDFMDLAPFEGKGLLPAAANTDEMRVKFEEFREALKATTDLKVSDRIKGLGPAKTSGDDGRTGDLTPDQMYNRLAHIAGTHDPQEQKEYAQLMEKWLASQSK
jgi:SMC interacting uncharacterized protein involved in chromosome segregation